MAEINHRRKEVKIIRKALAPELGLATIFKSVSYFVLACIV